MKRPTQSHPVIGIGLSRPTPSKAIPRPDRAGSEPGDHEPHRGGAAAALPSPDDTTLPAEPAAALGLPDRAVDEQLFAGRYRIERKLGRGGMGSVFLATQLAVDRKVAIKVLENVSDDGVMVARFQREARVIAQLQHPNIVNLIDFGENERGQLFLVMEYIDGEPLTGLIKREAPLDPARVVRLALQITEALAAAHDINVIHRDLKPDNIMLLGGGRRDYAKILDFGIAKVKRSDPGHQDTVQTSAGLIVGSLRYISPEQVESGEITVRTDLYALGGILYELLSGHRVFDYPSPADCAIAHLTEPPKPPVIDGVTLAGPLVDFIMQCLQKVSDRRPPNAHVAIAMLRACENAPLRGAEPSGRAPDPRAARPTAQTDAYGGATDLNLGPHPAALAATVGPAPISAPAIAPAPLPPASRPASRPLSRGERTGGALAPVEVTVTAYGQRTAVVPGDRMIDCSIDLRRPDKSPVGAIADLPMWNVAPGTGADPAHTVTHHAPLARAPERRGAHPVLWVLALIGLAGIGALIAILVIGTKTDTPPGGRDVPGVGANAGHLDAPQAPPTGSVHAVPASADTPDATSTGSDAATSVTAEPASADAGGAPGATTEASADVTSAPAPSPAVAANAVRIESDPPGAEVFLGDLSLGETSVTVTWNGEGTAPRLRLTKPGYLQQVVRLTRDDVGHVRTVVLPPLR